MPLFRAEDLIVEFGSRRALGPVTLELEAGERLAIVGESGAGKTVLGQALLNLLPAEASARGRLSFEDRPLHMTESALAPLRGRRITYVPVGSEGLDPFRRTSDELRAAARRSRDAVSSTAFNLLLADLGLDPRRLDRRPHALTPNERHLALLALALLPGPDLMVADEPGGNFDPVARRRVLDVILAVSARRKIALVLLTRDPRLAALAATEALVLRGGKTAETGRVDTVLAKPRDEYTRALIAAGKPRARALMKSPVGVEMLEIHGLSQRPPRRGLARFRPAAPPVLSAIDLVVRQAEAVAVVGPAAAGKTRLARIIAGHERPGEGQIVFDREHYGPRGMPIALRPEIVLVEGDSPLPFDPHLTAFDGVAEPLRMLPDLSEDAAHRRVLRAMELVGMTADAPSRPITSFSPGGLRRLMLARALVTRPRLLVLDEPAAGLDLRPSGDLLSLIARLRADLGLSLLIFTRDIDQVRTIADRLVVLDLGRIVEAGRPNEVLQAPRHRATAALAAARLPELG